MYGRYAHSEGSRYEVSVKRSLDVPPPLEIRWTDDREQEMWLRDLSSDPERSASDCDADADLELLVQHAGTSRVETLDDDEDECEAEGNAISVEEMLQILRKKTSPRDEDSKKLSDSENSRATDTDTSADSEYQFGDDDHSNHTSDESGSSHGSSYYGSYDGSEEKRPDDEEDDTGDILVPKRDVTALRTFGRIASRFRYMYPIAKNVRLAVDGHTGETVVVKIETYSGSDVAGGAPPKGIRVLLRLQNRPHLEGHVPKLVHWSLTGECFVVVTRKEQCFPRRMLLKALFKYPSKARTYLRKVIESTIRVHGENIIHRDLKPGNTLWNLQDESPVTLIDFALSTIQRPTGKKHTRYVGTRAYKCTEIERNRWYDERCDHYSIGVMVAQMIYQLDEDEVSDKAVRYWRFDAERKIMRARRIARHPPVSKRNKIRAYEPLALDLFLKLAHPEPELRISLKDALKHPYFEVEMSE